MKRHPRLERACRAFAAAALAVAGMVVAVAQAVAQVQLDLQQFVQPMIAPFDPQDGDGGEAIGDPWWDEAEAGRQAEKPRREAADKAQAEMLAQSVRQQGRAILRRELSLVRQSCPSLEKQQRALVLEAGRGAVDRAVDEQIQAVGGGRRPFESPTDLETAIREALKAAVK